MTELLTDIQATDVLAKAGCLVSVRTLHRWAALGYLPVVRVGPRFKRYRAPDVLALIAPRDGNRTNP